MKRLLILGALLLAGCARYETVPADTLVQNWSWNHVVEIKNHYCPTCGERRQ